MTRSILCVALVLLTWPTGVAGADAPAPGPAEGARIRQVIEAQLAAFGRDDGAAAFAYASPGIQRRFGTVARFMAMVRSGYGAVYRPREVVFRGLSAVEGIPVQEVLFVGPDGAAVMALYFMERQGDGSWRIDGVRLVPADDRMT